MHEDMYIQHFSFGHVKHNSQHGIVVITILFLHQTDGATLKVSRSINFMDDQWSSNNGESASKCQLSRCIYHVYLSIHHKVTKLGLQITNSTPRENLFDIHTDIKVHVPQ